MSYLGRKPIKIPDQVELTFKKNILFVKGPLGSNKRVIHPKIELNINDAVLIVQQPKEKQYNSLWGLYRKLITNMITGVSIGFSSQLEMIGVGYKAEVLEDANSCNSLMLKLGFSHPVKLTIPKHLKVSIIKTNKSDLIVVSGIDNEAVNSFASKIRDFRRPEPYKGKGLIYLDERIRRKEGKKK
jgi:large subunit ribosomal protein L6